MNTSKTSMKAVYSAPRLTVHGNVEEITRGNGKGHFGRPVGGGKGNGYGYGHCKNAGNPGHPEDPGECALS